MNAVSSTERDCFAPPKAAGLAMTMDASLR